MNKMISRFTAVILAATVTLCSIPELTYGYVWHEKQYGQAVTVYDDENVVIQDGGMLRNSDNDCELTISGNSDEQGAVNRIKKAWDGFEEEVDLSAYNIKISDIKDLYFNIINDNPEYFYIGNSYSYYPSGNYVRKIIIKYKYDKTTAKKMVSEYKAAVENVLAGIRDEWSELEKALYINDYLALNTEYDTTYSNYTAYDVLVTRKAVCQGYALAFNELAKDAGVESVLLSSQSLNHAWNMVKVGGSYYHVDATWDDPLNDLPGRARHIYFLKSSAYFDSEEGGHQAEDWVIGGDVTKEDAESEIYDDYMWNTINTAFFNVGDLWYTFAPDYRGICSYESDGSNMIYKEQVVSAAEHWPAGGGYYYSNQQKLACINNIIYYSTPESVVSYNPADGTKETYYTLTEEQKDSGYIYGLRIDEYGRVYIFIADTPMSDGQIAEVGQIEPACKPVEPTTEPETTEPETTEPETTEPETTEPETTEPETTEPETTEPETTEPETTEPETTEPETTEPETTEPETTEPETTEPETTEPPTTEKRRVSELSVILSEYSYTYNGLEHMPEVMVTDNDGNVISAENYDVKYENNIDAGRASVIIAGKNDFEGEKTLYFNIDKANYTIISDVSSYSMNEGESYQISAWTDADDLNYSSENENIATVDSTGLVRAVSEGITVIDISTADNKNYNKSFSSITVYVKKNETPVDERIDISSCYTYDITGKYVYDGLPKCPQIIVTDGITTLNAGEDYIVAYENNVDAGTAIAIVAGIGKYKGTIIKTFNIDKALNEINISKTVYNVTANVSRQVTLRPDVSAVGDITYITDNKKVKVTASGKVIIGKKFSGIVKIIAMSEDSENFYSDKREVTINIKPSETQFAFVKAGKKKAYIKWKKNVTATGYEIQLCTNSKFKSGVVKEKTGDNRKVTLTLGGLNSGKKYYVRIRAIKKVKYNGKTKMLYSSWSKVKTIKAK